MYLSVRNCKGWCFNTRTVLPFSDRLTLHMVITPTRGFPFPTRPLFNCKGWCFLLHINTRTVLPFSDRLTLHMVITPTRSFPFPTRPIFTLLYWVYCVGPVSHGVKPRPAITMSLLHASFNCAGVGDSTPCEHGGILSRRGCTGCMYYYCIIVLFTV